MPIEVQATQERMVFRVASESRKGHFYRVDLLAENGWGWCQCTDFGTRRWPNYGKPGAVAGTRSTCCKHISAARRFFLNDLLACMAKGETS